MNKRRNLPIVKGVAAATMFGLGISGHRENAGAPVSIQRALGAPNVRRDSDGHGERRRLGKALSRSQWVKLQKTLSILANDVLFSPEAATLAAGEIEPCFATGGIC